MSVNNHLFKETKMKTLIWAFAAFGIIGLDSPARAGRGGSTAAIKAAIASGSVDTIVAELERAEFLACTSCIAPVMQLADHPSYKVRQAAGWWLTRRGARQEVLTQMTARLQQS